jgi:hypothetical protein
MPRDGFPLRVKDLCSPTSSLPRTSHARDFYVGVLGGTVVLDASRLSSGWPTAG